MTVNSRKAREIKRFDDYNSAQERLPYWARSTNPIVRRHLGLYWRTVPPNLEPFMLIFGVWAGLIALGILVEGVFGIVMLSFIASLLVIPLTLIVYAHILLHVTRSTTRNMQAEMKNNTFRLLRTTPMSLPQIFLGKIAAALWERMDDWVLTAQLALAFSAPLMFRIYSEAWGSGGLSAPLLTLLALLVLMARMVLEPLMLGVTSVFIGLVVPGRSRAVTASVVLGAFYFLLLNLMANLPFVRGTELVDGTLLPPNQTLIFLFDFVLPLLLPLLVIASLLPLASRMVRD
jgi:hypothetical protein